MNPHYHEFRNLSTHGYIQISNHEPPLPCISEFLLGILASFLVTLWHFMSIPGNKKHIQSNMYLSSLENQRIGLMIRYSWVSELAQTHVWKFIILPHSLFLLCISAFGSIFLYQLYGSDSERDDKIKIPRVRWNYRPREMTTRRLQILLPLDIMEITDFTPN